MCRRGEIYFCDMGTTENGSIQGGNRPVLIVSNDLANAHSPVITVVPLTGRTWKKRYLPTHVIIYHDSNSGLRSSSLALAEQITSINKSCLGEYKGYVDDQTMKAVEHALNVQLGLQTA